MFEKEYITQKILLFIAMIFILGFAYNHYLSEKMVFPFKKVKILPSQIPLKIQMIIPIIQMYIIQKKYRKTFLTLPVFYL